MAKNNFVQGVISINQLKFPEKYCGRIKDKIVFRSSLEKCFMKYCDENPNILQWRSEEDIIFYKSPVDNRKHRYFMDFYIKFKNHRGQEKESLIEIKPYNSTLDKPYITEGMSHKSKTHAILEWTINQAKWKAADIYAKKRNMLFKKITDRDLYGHK